MLRRISPTSPLAALLLMGLGLGLVGCLPGDPAVTPPPTPDAEPVFASDEEALAAAEEAYGAYLAMSDAIIRDGGEEPERLRQFVSDDLFENEMLGFTRIQSQAWHGSGATTFTMSLQGFDEASIIAYSCDDLSGTDLLDGNGVSVVKPDRETRLPFEVELDATDSLRILRKEIWSGGGVC